MKKRISIPLLRPPYAAVIGFFAFLRSATLLLALFPALIHAANGLAQADDATVNPAPRVFGKPRMTQGHPCTLWDLEDIAQYKELLKTNPELKSAWEKLQAWGDKRIQEPLGVPEHRRDADGKWTFPSFKRGYQSPEGKWVYVWDFNTALQQRSSEVSKLGILYAFSGGAKYAAFAKGLLVALADAYGRGPDLSAPDPNGFALAGQP